ncbi:hypothetical protein UVI_02010790 [Ustilaginoidea virens]|uniref:Uncharacterized protein n=1 Tax=Ustilaginoidea virens TaxID=1159556 RepID=A0A1B5L271_USTVR|nr:hypothetical protein UVI_02010790 [Ustilaginoidea virens]
MAGAVPVNHRQAGLLRPLQVDAERRRCIRGLPESAPAHLCGGWTGIQSSWHHSGAARSEGYKLGVATNCSKKRNTWRPIRAPGGTADDGQTVFDGVMTAKKRLIRASPRSLPGYSPSHGRGGQQRPVRHRERRGRGCCGGHRYEDGVGTCGGLKKEGVAPLREGKSLNNALGDFLQ